MAAFTLNTYRRRDGAFMLYINSSNGVNVGISHDRPFSLYGKTMTEGKRRLYKAALEHIHTHSTPFTGDLAQHTEPHFDLNNDLTLAITDIATIGGQHVGTDGDYLITRAADGPAIYHIDPEQQTLY